MMSKKTLCCSFGLIALLLIVLLIAWRKDIFQRGGVRSTGSDDVRKLPHGVEVQTNNVLGNEKFPPGVSLFLLNESGLEMHGEWWA